jgi:hypothetical protein
MHENAALDMGRRRIRRWLPSRWLEQDEINILRGILASTQAKTNHGGKGLFS